MMFTRSCCALWLGGAFALLIASSLDTQLATGQEAAAQTDAPHETDQADVEPAPEAEENEDDQPLELDGVFQAVNAKTVQIDVQEWTGLKVVEAVAHGERVVAGDVLIELEADKLERAIEDAKHDIAVDELALRDAQIKLELARRNQDLALQAAEQADRTATEDLKDFLTDGRERRLRMFERSVESARNRLEYQAEELKQLEQMYAADDLTEETEEIILKRTRDAVESAQYSLDAAMNAQRKGASFDVPRTEGELERAVARAALGLDEASRQAPQSLERQELQFAKQELELVQERERLERLRADLKQMSIVAPRSGVIYFGTQQRGKWTASSSLEATLQPGGTPKAQTDLMTIVELRPMTVYVSVPEDSIGQIEVGGLATVSSIAYPDSRWPARFIERSQIPVTAGTFGATLELIDADLDEGIVPGMKARVTLGAPDEDDD